MTQIEIICKGRRLRTDDGAIEYSHESHPVLIDAFEGDPGSGYGWHSVRRKARLQNFVNLQGDEYIPRSKYGDFGRAEAARRFGTPTEEQQRMLSLPQRSKYDFKCKRCGFELSPRRREAVQGAFERIAVLATARAGAKQFGIDVEAGGLIRMSLRDLAAIVS